MLNSLMNPASPRELSSRSRAQLSAAAPRARLTLGLALLAVGLSSACAPVPLPDGERRVALRATTEQVILPTYAELRDRCAELSAALDGLASEPPEVDLGELRGLYLEARAPLKEAEAFGFGPATELRSPALLDQAPIAPQKIDAELAADTELTQKSVRAFGADKRGLHAIEYLLFPADDTDLEAKLVEGTSEGARRRLYLSLVGRIVRDAAVELDDAWSPASGDYARRFSAPGAEDSVSKTVQAGLDTLLNESVFLAELVADAKLGKPLGLANGGRIDPGAQESERSGASIADVLGNLRGIRNVYLGTRDGSVGASLSSLVQAKSPTVNHHALDALEGAEAAVRAIPEPLTEALVDEPETVTAAYDAIKTLKHVLATEVLGTLGASLKFNDNDGD